MRREGVDSSDTLVLREGVDGPTGVRECIGSMLRQGVGGDFRSVVLRRHPGMLCLRAMSGEEQRYQVTENVLFNVIGLILR
jgi:hypothetical protein